MQEALERHAHGISFRERNAGPDIDRDMSNEGRVLQFLLYLSLCGCVDSADMNLVEVVRKG